MNELGINIYNYLNTISDLCFIITGCQVSIINAKTSSIVVSASSEKANRPAPNALLGSDNFYKPDASDISPTLTFKINAEGEVTVRKVTLQVRRGSSVILKLQDGNDTINTIEVSMNSVMQIKENTGYSCILTICVKFTPVNTQT